MRSKQRLFRPAAAVFAGCLTLAFLAAALPAQAGVDCVALREKIADYEYFMSFCGRPGNASKPECVNSPREKAGKAALAKWRGSKCEAVKDTLDLKQCVDAEKELDEWMLYVDQCRINEANGPPLGMTCPDVRNKAALAGKKLDDLGCKAVREQPKKR